MLALLTDVRYGLRRMARRPGFAAIAIATLALGIGASATLFSVVQGVLWSPLPFKDSDRIVQSAGVVLAGDFRSVAARNSAFESLALYAPDFMFLTSATPPRGFAVYAVSPEFFPQLGIAPSLGRSFLPNEFVPGHDHEVILSHDLWQQLGADPALLGSTIALGGQPFTIVGVMPQRFRYHELASWEPAALVEAWIPLALTAAQLVERGAPRAGVSAGQETNGYYPRMIGHLRPGVSLAQARKQLHGIASALATENPDDHYLADSLDLVRPLDEMVTHFRKTLWLLFGASCLVLLIACVNVAALMIGEGSSRFREMAVRESLGASRAQLLRLALGEGIVVGIGGAALGITLAFAGLRVFLALAPPKQIPRLEEVGIHPWTLAFVVLAAVASVILASLLGAPRRGARRLAEDLRAATARLGLASGSPRYRRQRLLVLAQVAAAMVLLVAAALVVRSLQARMEVHPGLDYRHVVAASVGPASFAESRQQHEASRLLFGRLLGALHASRGISAAAIAADLFPLGAPTVQFSVSRAPSPGDKYTPEAWWQQVTSGYFEAFRIPLLRGRLFVEQGSKSDAEAVVNETLARRYFPDGNPLGHALWLRLPWVSGSSKTFQAVIVGVVGDVEMRGADRPVQPEIYTSSFWPTTSVATYVVVRTRMRPSSLAAILRRVTGTSGDIVVTQVEPIEEKLRQKLSPQRFVAALVGAFAFLALALALIGVYGLLAWATRLSTHEIGVRRALGAQNEQILRGVLGRAAILVLLGVALGALVAASLSRLLSTWLYGLSPADPLSYVVAALALLAAGVLAAFVPARRALRVEPTAALRYE
jgi:predicted permease